MRADNSSAQAAFAEASNYIERRPLVANDRPLSWITDHVCRIVEQPAPKWWWILTIATGAVATLVPAMLTYLVSTGVGVWGSECACLLGMGYHQLRFLDRNRSRRNVDLGHSISHPSKMANLHQPLG